MSILNGFKSYQRYLKTDKGYQLYSERQLARDVLSGDGSDDSQNLEVLLTQLQEKLNAMPQVHIGTTDPDSSLGNNGDYYLKLLT